jgi:phosphoribosyl 1,2-cyclic phosphodiesterase
LELAAKHQPQVILFNLLPQGGNGFQLCRKLREVGTGTSPQLIAVCARDYPADRQGAKEAGATHFLAKPLDASKFKELFGHLATGADLSTPPEPPSPAADATRLRFWGVRGSIPSPGPETVKFGGNTACVEVRAEGELIILDAGSGIRPLGLALAKEFQGRPLTMTLLITHTHWDHIQGFPFFVPAYNRQNTLQVQGYEGASRSLQATLSGQMESPYFPIGLKEMPGNIVFNELRDLNFSVGPVRVQATYVNHPGICVGYRLFTADGSITFIPDNEQYLRLKSSTGAEQSPESIEYARQQDQKLMDFIADSEVLIVDSQYDEAEYARHVGWGHSCVTDSVNLAIRAKVKRLFLFHHDPVHNDAKIMEMVRLGREMVARAGSKMKVEAAREGQEVVLRAKKRKVAVTKKTT